MSAKVTEEQTARINVDNTLSGRITANATAINGKAAQSALEAEIKAREDADNALTAQISDIPKTTVRYDIEQNLSMPQMQTARENIGAAGTDDIVTKDALLTKPDGGDVLQVIENYNDIFIGADSRANKLFAVGETIAAETVFYLNQDTTVWETFIAKLESGSYNLLAYS